MLRNSILNLELFQILMMFGLTGSNFEFAMVICSFRMTDVCIFFFILFKTPTCHIEFFFFNRISKSENLTEKKNREIFSDRNAIKYLLGDFPDNH